MKSAPGQNLDELRKHVREHPDDIRAAAMLAPALVKVGHTNEAADVLEQAIAKAPTNEHLANAAFLTAGTGGAQIARRLVTAYERAYQEHGESFQIAVSLCRMLGTIARDDATARRRQMDLALLGLDQHPDSFAAQINAHHAYMIADDETRAVEHLARAIAAAPRGGPAVPPLAIHLGMMLGKLGRTGEALAVLQDTLRSYGTMPHIGGMITHFAWTDIGLILLHGGDSDAALRALRASANVLLDESLKGSGLRTALVEELEKAGKADEVKWYRDLAEQVKSARTGRWLGKRGSVAYAKFLYRSVALGLWAMLSVIAGALLTPTFQKLGAKGSQAENMVGVIGVWYGLSILRGVLSRRVEFGAPVIRWAFGLVGFGILIGGTLFIVKGWMYGLPVFLGVALPGMAVMIRYQMLLEARQRRR